MELRPLVCLCLLTLSSTTSAEGSGPKVVIAQQDGEAVLPCSLSTEENIEFKLFDWTKTAPSDAGRREVFFYDAGIHYNNGRPGQSDEFKGRVSHFPEELKHGNASIIIRNIKMTDSGEYTCDFPHLQPQQTFHIKLVVDPVLKHRPGENITGAAPKPSVTTSDAKVGVLLRCEVEGDPQPTVEWQDSAGNKLPAGETQVSKRGGRVYYTLNATVTRSDNFRCLVTQKTLGHQTYEDIYVPLNKPTMIKVYKGRDVSLPCSLGTEENIESELFEWRKDGQKEVFMYDGGKHHNSGRSSQSEEFKGRVFHFPEELKHGDASITITNTKMSDRGNYTCDFPRLQPRQTFQIKLVVVDIGETEIGDGSESTPGWIGALAGVLGIVVLILVAVVVTLRIKQKRNKGSPVPQS